MTGTQKLIVVAVTLFIAFSRMTAVSKSMWEWDEALFTAGVHEYDVTQHHPHPPGYPLHVGMAKMIRPFAGDDFRAVQSVVVIAAMFLFPALFGLARAIGFGFTTSLCGAALYCFLPNVWYYGGTAFSDVPATVLGMAACVLLLRGRESSRSYIAGSMLLAISIGFRPQNLLMGLVPGILATWKRGRVSKMAVVAAALAGIGIVAASYGGAALASASPQGYVEAVKSQQDYVSRVDSFRNPGRPPLPQMAKLFFLKVIDHTRLMVILGTLAGVSILAGLMRRRSAVLMTVGIFGPFAIFAWLMLDPGAVSRYSVGYLPLYALLAADTLGAGFMRTRNPDEHDVRRVIGPLVQVSLVVLLASAFVRWAVPALRVVRKNVAPNVAALQWARDNTDLRSILYVSESLGPFADCYLQGRKVSYFADSNEIAGVRDAGHSYAVSVDGANDSPMIEWRYSRGKLWKIGRQRYFEAEVDRVSSRFRFGSGWYDAEEGGDVTWRWMGSRSVTMVPSIQGRGVLRIELSIPRQPIASPSVVLMWNGAEVDRFVAGSEEVVRAIALTSRESQPNELVITTSAVAHASGDPRELGLRLNSMSWNPAP